MRSIALRLIRMTIFASHLANAADEFQDVAFGLLRVDRVSGLGQHNESDAGYRERIFLVGSIDS
jgi:hypothetical protein